MDPARHFLRTSSCGIDLLASLSDNITQLVIGHS